MITRILIYLAICIIEIVVIACFISPDRAAALVTKEREMVATFLGQRGEQEIRQRADQWFHDGLYNNGVIKGSFQLVVPTKQQRSRSTGLENFGAPAFSWFERRMISIWHGVYGTLYRFSIFLAWIPYCLPIAIPAMVDGLVRREIKKSTFGYSSPVRYYAATHGLTLALFGLPMYFMAPTIVTPLFTPVWCVLMAYLIAMLTANIQKRI